jgi:hypothetical protein
VWTRRRLGAHLFPALAARRQRHVDLSVSGSKLTDFGRRSREHRRLIDGVGFGRGVDGDRMPDARAEWASEATIRQSDA